MENGRMKGEKIMEKEIKKMIDEARDEIKYEKEY